MRILTCIDRLFVTLFHIKNVVYGGKMPKLILFNKPYQVLSQFTDNQNRSTLADYLNIEEIYPAGRLDYDSEGLLLLTDNGKLQSHISHPKYKLRKTYWAQIEGTASQNHCQALLEGINLKDGKATACECELMSQPNIWPRTPPIRVRKTIPNSWIKLSVNEGRNRQVRRMTAAVGLPTLRLIRASVGRMQLADLLPGQFKVLHGKTTNSLLRKFFQRNY